MALQNHAVDNAISIKNSKTCLHPQRCREQNILHQVGLNNLTKVVIYVVGNILQQNIHNEEVQDDRMNKTMDHTCGNLMIEKNKAQTL